MLDFFKPKNAVATSQKRKLEIASHAEADIGGAKKKQTAVLTAIAKTEIWPCAEEAPEAPKADVPSLVELDMSTASAPPEAASSTTKSMTKVKSEDVDTRLGGLGPPGGAMQSDQAAEPASEPNGLGSDNRQLNGECCLQWPLEKVSQAKCAASVGSGVFKALTSMGFDASKAERALKMTDGSLERAANWILSGM